MFDFISRFWHRKPEIVPVENELSINEIATQLSEYGDVSLHFNDGAPLVTQILTREDDALKDESWAVSIKFSNGEGKVFERFSSQKVALRNALLYLKHGPSIRKKRYARVKAGVRKCH